MGAVPLLESLGYQPDEPRARRVLPELVQADYEIAFELCEAGVRLDLHWSTYFPNYRLGAKEAGLWNRTEAVSVGAHSFRVLGCEDQVLYLAAHAARHDWESLRRIVDIVELLRADEQLVVRATERAAAEWRILRLWHATLLLGVDWLDLSLPAQVLSACREDDAAVAVAAAVANGWCDAADAGPAESVLPWRTLFFQSLDGPGDRAKVIGDFFARPRVPDLELIRLPRPLWPLYAAIRPLRAVVSQRGGAVAKYLRRRWSPG